VSPLVEQDRGRELGRVRGSLEAVLEVVGGYPATVVEDDLLAEEERVGEAVLRDLPSLGDVGHDVQVEVERDEAPEDLDDVLARHIVPGLDGVEDGIRIAAEGDEAVLAADPADCWLVPIVAGVGTAVAVGGRSVAAIIVVVSTATGDRNDEDDADGDDEQGDEAHHQPKRAIGHCPSRLWAPLRI